MNYSSDIVEQLMEHYLRVPVNILKMQKVIKNPSAYLCLQFIWAKTSWKNNSDTISYSQFKDDDRYGTGLSIKTIQRSIEKLEELKLIIVKPSFNNMHQFSINIAEINRLSDEQVKSNSPQVKSNSPDLKDASPVNLSISQVNLTCKHGHSVYKPSQIDLHITTSTLLPFTTYTLSTRKLFNTDNSIVQKLAEEKQPSAKKLSPAKQERELLVKSLFDKWIGLSGQNIKPSKKRLSHINARLDDDFTEQQIIDAMTYVATDSWHITNGQNLIEIAVRSTEQLEKKLIKAASQQAQQSQSPASRTRSTPDPLAVNAKYDVPTEMTDEEKRAWFAGGTDSNMPSDIASDNDNSYYYG